MNCFDVLAVNGVVKPAIVHARRVCNNGNSTQKYLFWVLNDNRLQQPQTSCAALPLNITLMFLTPNRCASLPLYQVHYA